MSEMTLENLRRRFEERRAMEVRHIISRLRVSSADDPEALRKLDQIASDLDARERRAAQREER